MGYIPNIDEVRTYARGPHDAMASRVLSEHHVTCILEMT